MDAVVNVQVQELRGEVHSLQGDRRSEREDLTGREVATVVSLFTTSMEWRDMSMFRRAAKYLEEGRQGL